MNLDLIIRACQRAVGAYEDGKAGPDTWTKIFKKLTGADWHADSIDVVMGDPVDPRSEKNIATLLPEVQPYARSLVHAAAAQDIKLVVTGGTRTYAEQNALEAKRPKVTNARGGYSNHNFGIAFDVTIFNGKTPVWDSPAYKAVGALGRSIGLEWGGDWKSFVDEPHFQFRPRWAKDMKESAMLAELRRRKAAGESVFA